MVELSLRSMSELGEEKFMAISGPEDSDAVPSEEQEPTIIMGGEVETRLIPLRPLDIERPVVSVDTSSLKLGETGSGLVIALRGAIVWRRGRYCRYLRLGPFVFHITEQNKDEIYNELRRYCLGLPGRREAPSLPYMPMRMSNIFDLWLRE
ncbi:hypothetical protein DRO33_05965, partial [Candidatus Bathyarchaeota archaeon]